MVKKMQKPIDPKCAFQLLTVKKSCILNLRKKKNRNFNQKSDGLMLYAGTIMCSNYNGLLHFMIIGIPHPTMH